MIEHNEPTQDIYSDPSAKTCSASIRTKTEASSVQVDELVSRQDTLSVEKLTDSCIVHYGEDGEKYTELTLYFWHTQYELIMHHGQSLKMVAAQLRYLADYIERGESVNLS